MSYYDKGYDIPEQNRKFGGVTYKHLQYCNTKADAEKLVKIYRKRGMYARFVKAKWFGNVPKKGYEVYMRYK